MPTLSGQAVIEGVVFRAPGSFAVAVRRPTGEIVVRERPWRCLQDRWPALRLPVVRGVASLVDGVRATAEGMSFAAVQAGLHGSLAPAAIESARPLAADRRPSWLSVLFSGLLAVVSGTALFVVLSHFLAACLSRVPGLGLHSVTFHLVVGGCKLAIFIGYILLMGTLPDIRRLFMYHGAEHKVLAAHAQGVPMELGRVRPLSMHHDRCGTTFMLLLALCAIMLFSVIFPLLPGLGYGWRSHLVAMAVKVPLLLPLVGIAYELNAWCMARLQRTWVRRFTAPARWLQRMTVREPNDAMLEVALAAFKAAQSRGRRQVVTQAAQSTLVYQSFADVCARQV